MPETKTYAHRGIPFLVHAEDDTPAFHPHPSYFTFEDEQTIRDRWWNIECGDFVIDIGAAYGSYVLPALVAGASHVIAFSPQIEYPVLLENLKLNGWDTRCTVFDFGLYDRDGWIDPDEGMFTEDRREFSLFRVTTLDKVMASDPHLDWRVDWIKIDVEGAEVEVLRGAQETIKRWHPKLLIENHLFRDPELDKKCRWFVESLGLKYQHATVPYHSVSHTLYTPVRVV